MAGCSLLPEIGRTVVLPETPGVSVSRLPGVVVVAQRVRHALLAVLLLLPVIGVIAGRTAHAAAGLPSGFRRRRSSAAWTQPTNVEFSPDGRVFVAEKSGIIKVFDSLTDTTPSVFADLRTKVHNFWDRGLLGSPCTRTSRPTRGSTCCTRTTA